MVKEYAYTNSMVEVVKRINDRGFTKNERPIDKKICNIHFNIERSWMNYTDYYG